MPLENSHETPDWCNYMRTARNSPINGFHVMYSELDLKTRDLQSRNWDFHLFSELWSSLLILLLKLDAASSYTQKEIHRHISHETCIANQIQNIKTNEYFVSSRPAGSCSGLNRQPLSTVVQTRRTRRTWQLGCHVGNLRRKISVLGGGATRMKVLEKTENTKYISKISKRKSLEARTAQWTSTALPAARPPTRSSTGFCKMHPSPNAKSRSQIQPC